MPRDISGRIIRTDLFGRKIPKKQIKKDWFVFSHLLQAFGRDICRARNPAHASCPLEDICPSSSIQA